jgi:oxygen-dependent protoporphyrinogen oxidase
MDRRDVVVVGGGIGGLTAAWMLRDRDVLLLEREARVGGRIMSERRGDYWLSVGAHMFPEPASVVGRLVTELGLRTLSVRGTLLGVHYRGRTVTGDRPEIYPFRLPLSPAGRLSFARAGLKIRRAATRYTKLAQVGPGETDRDVRHRLLAYLDDRTFADFIGPLHPDAEQVLRATVQRLTAEPEEAAAGGVVALFAHVWSSGGVVLGRNLEGGAGQLPEALAAHLGDRVQLGAEVDEVALDGDGVRVRYRVDGREEQVEAATAILACPAYVTRRILVDPPAETARALDGIPYGPICVAGILTKERGRMPWDGVYSLLCVGTSFNMLFNHASCLRSPDGQRAPGGTLMVYGNANLARRLFELTDDGIRDRFVADLDRVFPGSRAVVEDVWVKRWPDGIPYAPPGRSRLQATLERGVGERIFLAGDYVGEWTHMESAALTAVEAAARARAVVAAPAPAAA